MAELMAFADKAASENASETSMLQFKIMYEEIGNLVDEFRKNHHNVVSLMATLEGVNLEEEEIIRKEFEYNRVYVYANYSILFPKKGVKETVLPEPLSPSPSKPNLRLPKVEIPKFSGDLKVFKPFLDLFTSLVHENASLSKIEKFNYLISFLEGPPLSLVQCTPMTADNYELAFNSLRERYDNKRLIAFTHLQIIDGAPFISNSKNVKTMRLLVDTFTENLSALKNLGFDIDSWDFLLFYMFSKHLDSETMTRFELEEPVNSNVIPTFESLKKFVVKHVNALETIDFSSNKRVNIPKFENKFKQANNPSLSNKNKQTYSFFSNINKSKCHFCNADHEIYRCSEFQNKSPSERLNIVKSSKWCTNCLSNQHSFKNCNSQSLCRLCNAKHHTLLHLRTNNLNNYSQNNNPIDSHQPATDALNFSKRNESQTANESQTQATTSTGNNSNSTIVNSGFTGLVSSSTNVLLSTAVVEILDSRGLFQKIRVLLDCGSQTSYISMSCLKRLGLKRFNLSFSIQGLGSMREITSHGATTCKIRPVSKNSPCLTIEAVILEKLCPNMPASILDNNKDWSYLENINLADPHFNRPASIDLIIGAELFPYILQDGRIASNNDMPVAINTIFGFVIMGKLSSETRNTPQCITLFSSINNNDILSLDSSLKRFWEIEEIPKTNFISPEDELCEKIFTETVSRNSDGRYIVHLPFKNNFCDFDLESSRSLALKRFYSLERRLNSNTQLYKKYSDTIQEYLDNDVLELIPESSFKTNSGFYIPHHPVVKDDKIRIVYDASAKPENGCSLNESLLVGPKMQKDIFCILLNFRLHVIVFTCDIKSMFTQILITNEHKDFQRMLWRFSPNENVKDYRLKRVTFGISSSPYLANRVIAQLNIDEGKNYHLASDILNNQLYVDDAVVSCVDLSQARLMRDQLIELLGKGGFEVRKFASNSDEFLSDIPESHLLGNSFNFDIADRDSIKILGLHWDARQDAFVYYTSPSLGSCTKRRILSDIARCFDPVGWMSPLTLFCKLLMQVLWTLGIDWDEIPPPHISEKWLQYKSELPLLTKFSLPRRFLTDSFKSCELHGFSDASQKAYACCIYFRILKQDHTYEIFFVAAKAKVAPLRTICIPRLELLAAVMLSDLMKLIFDNLSKKINFSKVVAWSDSKIALTWIRSPPYRWKTFISNRVARVQENFPPSIWRFVGTHDNPADCASRGLLPSELINHELWWKGPSFLSQLESSWPAEYLENNFDVSSSSEIISEERHISLAAFTEENGFDHLLNTFSSLSKILRILCYVLRFIYKLKGNKTTFKNDYFTYSELTEALFVLVKYVQSVNFLDEITAIKNKTQLSKPFRKLNPFLDDRELLRVGGRLGKADLSYYQKHPALLPRCHRLTTLIIEHFHKIYSHPGTQTLHFLIMQQFWILAGKRAITSVVHKCMRCWKLQPKSYQPTMGNLPKLRISQLKAFSCVGVDYAGPFSTTPIKRRGIQSTKSYICLFVCFATKALHLELASDLSSEAFLCAFRRFISRRGRCSMIFSDCGTNFVGARKQLFSLFQNAAETENIEWKLHPPSGPHFSGLAEAGVKSVKTHLNRVLGQQVLTYEEFYTVLVQIEALLNSRPISPISSDPNDLSALTPGHFLTLEPISSLPDTDLSSLKLNSLSRWQLLQRLHQDFWSRWHLEYLHTLQQRGKWLNDDNLPHVQIGSMVVIKNETTSPSNWRLGRVLRLHPGTDGICRVATVHTTNGDIKRPLVKLCPLPMQLNE